MQPSRGIKVVTYLHLAWLFNYDYNYDNKRSIKRSIQQIKQRIGGVITSQLRNSYNLEVSIQTKRVINGKAIWDSNKTKLPIKKQYIMEQQKRSAVTNVTANGTYNGQYGTLYKFEVTFANGDSGEYASKSQNQTKFVVGQETDYTITSKEFKDRIYYKIAPVMAQPQQGGFQAKAKDPETSKHIMRMSVLKVAGDLAINGNIQLNEILSYASIFEAYVVTGMDTLSKYKVEKDDLPF